VIIAQTKNMRSRCGCEKKVERLFAISKRILWIGTASDYVAHAAPKMNEFLLAATPKTSANWPKIFLHRSKCGTPDKESRSRSILERHFLRLPTRVFHRIGG